MCTKRGFHSELVQNGYRFIITKPGFWVVRFILFIAHFLCFNIIANPWCFSQGGVKGDGDIQIGSNIVVEPYLYEGDVRMFNGEMEGAQNIYEFVLKEEPQSYHALWRLSRFYISRGMAAKKIKDKKKEWKKAESYGRHAVEINPDGAEGHLYLAIAIGKLALYSSSAEKVKAVWEVKKEAQKAIQLDPTQQKAYLTLGAWHRNVATASSFEKQLAKIFFGELPEGSLKESLQLLLKSVSLGGTNVRNYYELALTYESMGDYEAAKREYENALEAHSIYPEDTKIKNRIKKTLRKSRYN
jgi:tetratricopeptide (TPR) repeat protein